MAQVSQQESTWLERQLFEEAEHDFHTHLAKGDVSGFKPINPHHHHPQHPHAHHAHQQGSLSGEVAKAREHIRKTLNGVDSCTTPSCAVIYQKVQVLEQCVSSLTSRLEALEKFCKSSCHSSTTPSATTTTCTTVTLAAKDEDAEDDFELFGSDEEDGGEGERVKEERVAAYQAKKGKKPALIAKSNVIFDVKPWDDETDMKKLEECVRGISMDGLLWGASKLVPLAYGIKKLQITSVVEDDKVSTEELEERITAFEDYIQSVDIAAFNKI